ncbi:hotdog fold thioesterase [Streptacidiphilus sp. ASG 303]|uniref:PaaI family thioesterase n=1 Tax=Streptacidiphilus sp. ASG 303 TaxID=2896847 RepID=UPI001E54E7D8|nr:hotdog fold thioesterase [Streptacidiphilus sp. ASG 303]MCD0481553.1 hotdog fold thioesterase [Streptacidiphilus sp. ASG 303]
MAESAATAAATGTSAGPDGPENAPHLDIPQDVIDHFARLGVDPATFSGGDLGRRMGIRVVEASPERVVGTMPVDGNRQPYGLLHGGASAALAETLGSVGAMLHAGPGRYAVGVDLNATHHRSATSGIVTGVATAVYRGRTAATYEIAVTDDQGRRITSCRLTCMLRDT